jgi:hypothetical protein
MQTEAMEEGSLGGQTTLQLSKRGNCQVSQSRATRQTPFLILTPSLILGCL